MMYLMQPTIIGVLLKIFSIVSPAGLSDATLDLVRQSVGSEQQHKSHLMRSQGLRIGESLESIRAISNASIRF
jgi:hypothetical protein